MAIPRSFVLILSLIMAAQVLYAQSSKTTKAATYQCVPCGYDCDKTIYDHAGKCPHCQMDLVDVRTITFKTIAPEHLCAYINAHPNVLLLDVRTKEEFEGKADPNFGTLKNAVNVPVQDLEARLPSLADWKGRDIIVYCSHSHRSPRASWILSNNGFKKVTNMAGGMSVLTDRSCVK